MEQQLQQRAILVGVDLEQQADFRYAMDELRELAIACDVEVIGEVTQQLTHVNTSYYIGKGKVQAVAEMIDQTEANLVIFNDELSPSQIRNLESSLNCKVIDRTILILDIFAQRARTREAQLQVDIAQMQYMLPRLVGLRASLGRQSGGVGTTNRGSGEKQLELDRRQIEARIVQLNKELKKLVIQRQTQRKRRQQNRIPVVALVGYTNAGKSTLLNAMLTKSGSADDKQVLEKNMLFATLETSVRKVELPDKKSFLLTDTVGFVSRLPHHLIKAFRSTLEEVADADLLIHVVDYAHPEFEKHIETTLHTLEEIGVKEIPTIYAYNKADLTETPIPRVQGDHIYLSAKQQRGIDELTQLIQQHVFRDYKQCEMFVPYDQDQIVAQLHERAHIFAKRYEDTGTVLALECSQADYQRYQAYLVQ